jgi:hypothetical protein
MSASASNSISEQVGVRPTLLTPAFQRREASRDRGTLRDIRIGGSRGCWRFENMMETDKDLRESLKRLMEKLK